MILKIKSLTVEGALSVLGALLDEIDRLKTEMTKWKQRERSGQPGLSPLGWKGLTEPLDAARNEYVRLNHFVRTNYPDKYGEWKRKHRQ